MNDMNEKINWDQSLVKKYSSSNHFKLLKQLRSEIIKYPLKNKKNLSSNIKIQKNNSQITNLGTSSDLEFCSTNNINTKKEAFKDDSNISFNNSKNFSIYKNIHEDSNNIDDDIKLSDIKKSKKNLNHSKFKDRLDLIDMK